MIDMKNMLHSNMHSYDYIGYKKKLTAIIILPDAENDSPAISISTVVSAPLAG